MKNIKVLLFAALATLLIYSCSPADGNFPGSEYMPDMGHSIAIEGNVYTYYYYNTWDSASTKRLKQLANPGLPVDGTIPRGYAGIELAKNDGAKRAMMMKVLRGKDATNSIAVPVNGSAPYYYENTEESRDSAIRTLIQNPYPITEEGLAKGEDLYNIYCGICHGEKGDGAGYLVRDPNPVQGDPGGVYPAAPANLLLDDYANSSNGRYYHAIMYGKNVMGGYADKMSYEERWQVIHWIRALQAKDKKLEYSAAANTLNDSFGTPASQYEAMAELMMQQGPALEESHEEGETHDGEGEHESDGDDHGDDSHHSTGEGSHSGDK